MSLKRLLSSSYYLAMMNEMILGFGKPELRSQTMVFVFDIIPTRYIYKIIFLGSVQGN